jgi:uncharacterized protein YqgV (UPF0045/DUF77 family)
MIVTVEISYYPLAENYNAPISEFIDRLTKNNKLKVEFGRMSSSITGEYEEIMKTLTESMGMMMETNPSVFNIKISNSCPV